MNANYSRCTKVDGNGWTGQLVMLFSFCKANLIERSRWTRGQVISKNVWIVSFSMECE